MGGILKFLGGSALGILNTIFSVFSAGMNGAMSLVKSAFQGALQYHQAGIEFARGMGMSLQQAQAYTTVLTERAADLGFKYGVAAEAVKELQQNLAEATGKAAMLNDVDAEKFLQINKLVGSNVTKQFTSEIMNHLGGQIHTVEGAVSKAYATAAKSGLNAAQFSEKVARNLSMANKLSFRDGVNGIIRMTALSEKLGFNLQSVEKAAENFMEIDKAIENSAKLQMLGGAAGAYGSNPLTMAYEANYDPEAFTERMTNTLGGYAQFDTKTGMAKVNGMNRDFVKNIAQAMGISMDEAMSIAKKQAEIKYKESSGLADKVRSMNLSDEQKDYLINSSYVGKDGQLKMTDANGKEKNVSEFTADELEKMMSLEGKSDEEIMRQQALTLTSINEKIEGLQTSAVAELAKAVNPHIDEIQGVITSLGNTLLVETRNLVTPISNAIGGVTKFVKDHLPAIQDLMHTAANVLGFIFDHWKLFLGIYAGVKIFGMLGNLIGIFRSGFNLLSKGGGAVTRTARAAAKGGKWLGGKVWQGVTNVASKAKNVATSRGLWDVALGRQHKNSAGRWVNSKGRFISNKLATVGKVAKVGGAALGAGIGLFNAVSVQEDYASKRKELNNQLNSGAISKAEYDAQVNEARKTKNEGVGEGIGTAAGAVIGTAIAGPLGAAVGGWLGGVGGKIVGKHWDDITSFISKGWNKVTSAFSSVGSWVKDKWHGITDWFSGAWGSVTKTVGVIFTNIGDWFRDLWNGIGNTFNGIGEWFRGAWGTVTKAFDTVGGWFRGAWGSVVGFFSRNAATIGKVAKAAFMPWTLITDNWTQITTWFSDTWHGITDWFSGAWGSVTETVGEIFTNIGDWFRDLWNGVGNTFNGIGEWFRGAWGTVTGAFDTVGGWFRGAWEGAVGTFNAVGEWLRGAWEGVTNVFSTIGKFLKDTWIGFLKALNKLPLVNIDIPEEGHANGGIVGGNSFSGDRVLAGLNSGEMVLNKGQQSKLFSFLQNSTDFVSRMLNPFSMLTNSNDVKAKPVGEREYIYEPKRNDSTNGVSEVTVRDINVKVNGTIKLDGGNSIKNLDISQLLNDTSFVSSLKELIKQSINNDINGGRIMNDNALRRGMVTQTSLWGRK